MSTASRKRQIRNEILKRLIVCIITFILAFSVLYLFTAMLSTEIKLDYISFQIYDIEAHAGLSHHWEEEVKEIYEILMEAKNNLRNSQNFLTHTYARCLLFVRLFLLAITSITCVTLFKYSYKVGLAALKMLNKYVR